MSAVLYDFFTNIYVIQAIGFVAFGFGVSAFLMRDDRRMKILLVAQCVVLTIHFGLLGASSAPFVTGITATRNFMSLFGKIKILFPVFITAYLTFGYYSYEGWVDLLPILSPIFSTFGLFYLDGIRMRLCFLIATSCWVVHNLIVGSIGPFFMEAFILSSNLFTILTMAGILKKRIRK